MIKIESHSLSDLLRGLPASSHDSFVDTIAERQLIKEPRNEIRSSSLDLQFIVGRSCALEALRKMGIVVGRIPRQADRTPDWPDGVVGSITHCDGYSAAVVVKSCDIAGIGIDAEPLSRGLFLKIEFICKTSEILRFQEDVGDIFDHNPIFLFVAKEAVYKSLIGFLSKSLTFRDIVISFYRDGYFLASVDNDWHAHIQAIGRVSKMDRFALAVAIPDEAKLGPFHPWLHL